MARVIIPLVLGLLGAWAQAQESGATTQPASVVIQASDKEAIAAAMGNDVVIEGIIASAAWSRSGKVMNIEFADASESGLLAVIFERTRADMDAAFGGDVSKALTGAKVRLRGTLQPYGGRSEAMKGRPQIIINRGDQITIVEPATAPTTQP